MGILVFEYINISQLRVGLYLLNQALVIGKIKNRKYSGKNNASES